MGFTILREVSCYLCGASSDCWCLHFANLQVAFEKRFLHGVSSSPEDKNSRHGLCKLWTTCQIFNFKRPRAPQISPRTTWMSFTHQLPEPTTQIFLGAAIMTLTSRKELLLVQRQTHSDTEYLYQTHTHSWGLTHPPGLVGSFYTHTHTRWCSYSMFVGPWPP